MERKAGTSMMNATNAMTMREKNRRMIIDLIRKYEFSRAELAKETSLTKAAISIIVDDLMKNGVVQEYRSEEKSIGRRPLCLKLNPDFMYAVGLNITRSHVKIGIVDISGRVVCERRLEVSPKKEALKQIVTTIGELVEESGVGVEKIYGIGVTAPGPVDTQNTTILNPTNFDEWHYENIGLRLKNALDKKVFLENVAGGRALSEKYFGLAKDWTDYLVFVVSDGIGSGIMNSGKLLRHASELGHTSIAYNGIPCECGNLGCIEKYASMPAILQGTPYQSWQEVVDAEDDALIEKEAEYLSCVLINAVNVLGFESVILHGAANYKPQKLMNAIAKKLKHNTITGESPKLYSGSAFSEVVSAAATVFDNYFNKF
jgi:predicted NBD/HSP70 family sugar kinase